MYSDSRVWALAPTLKLQPYKDSFASTSSIERQRRAPCQPGATPQVQNVAIKPILLRAEGPIHNPAECYRYLHHCSSPCTSIDKQRDRAPASPGPDWAGLQPSIFRVHPLILGRCPRLIWDGPSALQHRGLGITMRSMPLVLAAQQEQATSRRTWWSRLKRAHTSKPLGAGRAQSPDIFEAAVPGVGRQASARNGPEKPGSAASPRV